MNRRLMAFTIGESFLMELFGPRLGIKVVHSDLPEGAQIYYIFNDYMRNCFVVVFQHESFPEVPEGEEAPFGDLTLEVRYIKEEEGDNES